MVSRVLTIGLVLTVVGSAWAGVPGVDYSFGEWAADTGLSIDATYVAADGAGITKIEADDLAGMDNLETLGLGGNEIISIETGAFSGKQNLYRFEMDPNPPLVVLNLSGAQFRDLTFFSIRSTAVDTVDLTNAQLSQLAFNGITNVLMPDIFHNCSLIWLGPYISFFMVTTMFYAIVQYQLLDINIVFRSITGYSLAIASLSTIFVTALFLLGRLFDFAFPQNNIWIVLLIVSILAISFHPVYRWCTSRIDKWFFKGTLPEISKEKERIEEELKRSERLASIGMLASGLLHEIKNPLTPIKAKIELLPDYLPKDIIRGDKNRYYLVCVIDSCTRIAWAEVIEDITALTVMFATLRCLNYISSEYKIKFAEVLTDNGSEFGPKGSTKKEQHPFERMLKELGVIHRYTRPYRPQTNGKAERFWRTLNEDLIEGTDFDSIEEFREELLQYILYYNQMRPHQSLGGKTQGRPPRSSARSKQPPPQ